MKKILIIDDDPDFQEITRRTLEERGLAVCSAYTPDEGVEKVGVEKPDLVILDVLMPSDYEGFDVARKIREDLGLRDLPILMLTAVHDIKKVPYRFAPDETWNPVDVFLDKPVDPDMLVEKTEELLGTYRREPSEPL